MKDDRYITLIYKSLKGETTPVEQSDLEQWSSVADNQALRDRVTQEWSLAQNYEPDLQVDVAGDFAKLKTRINQAKSNPVMETKAQPKVVQMKSRNRSWMSMAAGVAILIAGGLWLFNPFHNVPTISVTTASNETQKITLPDGSVVTLNENSTLTYPEHFEDDSRMVTLTGEGFFDIVRNEEAMFVARTKLADVEVLGTSFNIDAYPGTKRFEVSVTSGLVQMRPRNSSKAIKAEKGKVAVYNLETKQIYINWANPNADRWRTGVLSFEDQYLRDVILEIEKEFDVTVILDRKDLEGCKITARFEDSTAEVAMKYLAKTFEMKLEVDNEIEYHLIGGVSCVQNVTYQ